METQLRIADQFTSDAIRALQVEDDKAGAVYASCARAHAIMALALAIKENGDQRYQDGYDAAIDFVSGAE